MKNKNLIKKNFMEKGDSYFGRRDYKKAIDCYDQAFLIDHKYLEALYNKGVSLKNLIEY